MLSQDVIDCLRQNREVLKHVSELQIPNSEYEYLSIKRRYQNSFDEEILLFAIQSGSLVLNRDLEWCYEPLPSNRTEDFIKNTRFTFDEAVELLKKLLSISA